MLHSQIAKIFEQIKNKIRDMVTVFNFQFRPLRTSNLWTNENPRGITYEMRNVDDFSYLQDQEKKQITSDADYNLIFFFR